MVLLGAGPWATGSASRAGSTSGALIRAAGNQSTNWSGYAEAGSFTSIAGSWNVPAVVPTPGRTTYASTWVGVDGLANRHLIQTGTESDQVGGVVRYDAWWEVLPAAERVVRRMVVHPGDHMTATIVRTGPTRWTITLADTTTGLSFAVSHRYTGSGLSAEWIEERPQVGGALTTLSPVGTTLFSGLATNGTGPHLVAADALAMVASVGGPVIAAPSALSASGTSFAVAYGPVPPARPVG